MKNSIDKNFPDPEKLEAAGEYDDMALKQSHISKPVLVTEQIHSLRAVVPAAVTANLLVGVVTVWLLSGVQPLSLILAWYAFLFISQMFRLAIFHSLKHTPAPQSAFKFLALLRASALCSGVTWGALSVFLFPTEFAYQVFLAFVVSGVTGAALGGLASDRISVLLLCISALMPLSVQFLMAPDELSISMGIMGLMYQAYIVSTSISGEHSFSNMIRLKEQAEAGSRTKSAFLAKVSHEIRTPLNAITGLVELLGYERSSEEYKKIVRHMNQSVAALTGIIDDVLDLSKIEASSLDIRPEPIQIRKLVEATIESFRSSAMDTGLFLEHKYDEKIPDWVKCDPTRLRQIVFNILDNALKFTSQGGVTISTSANELAGKSVEIVIAVRDSGVGISVESQAKLFQPFVQVNDDVSNLYGGAGLGLVISRKLSELMGGHLTLQSDLDVGTTVTLYLTVPILDRNHSDTSKNVLVPAQQSESKTALTSTEKLLIVDDNAINRLVLSRQLHVLGYQHDQAVDGRDAIEKLDSSDYVMVITDCHMPRMDGYKLTRIIREREALTHQSHRLPILGYTANAMHRAKTQCLDAGMDNLLVKPVTLEQLRSHIVQYILPAENSTMAVHPSSPETSSVESGMIIDWHSLGEIIGNDQEFVREVLKDFLLEKTSEATLLGGLLDTGNVEEIQRIAHRMKGAAKTIAAVPLSSVCEQIEFVAESGNREIIASKKQELEFEFHRLKDYIEQNSVSPVASNS